MNRSTVLSVIALVLGAAMPLSHAGWSDYLDVLKGAVGEGGEIFVLEMGQSINITYLAEQMIRLSGREPGTDVPIVYTGLRPGEKLHEELFHVEEDLSPTSHDKLLLAAHSATDRERIQSLYEELQRASDIFDEEAIRRLLTEAVPELTKTHYPSAATANILNFTRSN